MKQDNKWESQHKDITAVVKFIFGLWFVVFATLIIGFLLKELIPPKLLTTKGFTLEDLNNIGGTLNIITSLTGVATLYLISQTIKVQKEEANKVIVEMEAQKGLLEQQILVSKTEANTERTFKEVDKWNRVRTQLLKEPGSLEAIREVALFLDTLSLVHKTNLKDKLNFTLLSEVIVEDKELNQHINDWTERLDSEIDYICSKSASKYDIEAYELYLDTGTILPDANTQNPDITNYYEKTALMNSLNNGLNIIHKEAEAINNT